MTVYVLVPVFNRVACTQEVIRCLRAQRDVDLKIVVIDDGSTDGTAEYLRGEQNLLTLKGDGSLWWGGAIHLAQKFLSSHLADDDFLLFVNNDTTFGHDYVQTLVRVSEENDGAVVGSALREDSPPHTLISIGPMLDIPQMRVWDRLVELPKSELQMPLDVYEVDALPGRGTLYPVRIVSAIGLLRPRLLPHYYADYEYAARARRQGYRLLVSTAACVYTGPEFGNDSSRFSFLQRHFSTRSAANIWHRIVFYLMVGSWTDRLLSIPRMIWRSLVRWIRPPIYASLHWGFRQVAAWRQGKRR